MWEPVAQFPVAPDAPGDALRVLDGRLREHGIAAHRFQSGDVLSLVVPIQVLQEASSRKQSHLSLQWGSLDTDRPGTAIFVSSRDSARRVEPGPHALEGLGEERPEWVGVPVLPGEECLPGDTPSLLVDEGSGGRAIFLLSRLASQPVRGAPSLKPFPAKIGEGRGNLRARSDWFQRRAGRDSSGS